MNSPPPQHAAYVIYSVNSNDPEDEENETPGYDRDTDGLNHVYIMVNETTPSCKQYYTMNHKPVGPVYYKYNNDRHRQQQQQLGADSVQRDGELRVFLCMQ